MPTSIIYSSPNDFWIQDGAIRFELNALSDPDKIAVSLASGAVIMAWKQGVIDYNAGLNYRTWVLSAAPTHFNRQEKVYVYVRLSKVADTAQLVFPYEKIPLDPALYYDESDESDAPGYDLNSYYILLGALTPSLVGGETTNRYWSDEQGEEFSTGILDTDEYRRDQSEGILSQMFVLNETTNTIETQKDLTFIAGKRLLLLRMRILGWENENAQVTAIATSDSIPDSGEFTPNDTSLITTAALARYAEYVLGNKFFRKDQDDVDPYTATFGDVHVKSGLERGEGTSDGNLSVDGDAEIGGKATVQGKLTANDIAEIKKLLTLYEGARSSNYVDDEIGKGGWKIDNDDNGASYMVVDKLLVRMKAIFNELEIRKLSYAGGNIVLSHAGSKIIRVAKLYENPDTHEIYEWQPYHIELTSADATWENNGITLSDLADAEYDEDNRCILLPTAELVSNGNPPSDSQIKAYRCYLLKDDGTTATENWWHLDDQAKCQTFNVVESGNYQNAENTYYWRLVVGIGTGLLEDGNFYDYVDLSKADCDTSVTNDVPKEGDSIVQMGNRTDTDRQGFITLEVYGDDAPAIKMYKMVNEYSLTGKRYICISPKDTSLIVNSWKLETDYGVFPQLKERGNWSYILSYDEQGNVIVDEHGNPVHRCYYYDLVQHNGATWYCIYPESGSGGIKYTTEEPSNSATYWRIYAQKGEKGDSVSYDAEHSSVGYAYSSMGSPETGREYPSDITTWSSTVPAVQKGKYLWTKDVTAYDNAGTIVYTTTYGVEYQPNDGDSVEIDTSRTFIKYCKQTKNQYTGQHPADNQFSTTYPSSLGQGDYLWILNQVAYVGVTNPLKSYSVSMLGTDGATGDPGADGYTTHFAYATSADGSQNFSTTNFDGATYIGTYRDQNAADSQIYTRYVWTKWKGDGGLDSATCYIETPNVFVPTDKDGNVKTGDGQSFTMTIPFYVIAGNQALAHYSVELEEEGSTHYVTLGGEGAFDVQHNVFVRNQVSQDDDSYGISIEGAHVEGNGIVISGNVIFAPSDLIVTVANAAALIEHKAYITVTALDDEGNEYTVMGAIEIKGRKEGENAVQISLDNVHEDFLYNDSGNITGTVTSQARLYDGGNAVTSGVTWQISLNNGSSYINASESITPGTVANAKISSGGLLTVETIKVSPAKIIVRAKYPSTSNNYYYAEFTGNKTSNDTYELKPSQTSIPYNSATYSPVTIKFDATRLDISGTKSAVTISNTSGSGEFRLFYTFDSLTNYHQITTPTAWEVTSAGFSSNNNIIVELRKYDNPNGNNNSSNTVVDYQNIAIVKAENGQNGTNGTNGTDAVNVIVTPASLIVNQDLNNKTNLSTLSEVITFAVTKGTTQMTVTKVEIPSTGDYIPVHCTVSGNNSGNTATVTAIGTYTQSGKSYYYDTAYFFAKVYYTDGNTTKYIDNVKVRIYANLLGTWSETVEADTKTEIAERTLFDICDETGAVVATTTLANFTKSSSENTAKLEETVDDPDNGLVKKYSEINQTVNNISLKVGSYHNLWCNAFFNELLAERTPSVANTSVRIVKKTARYYTDISYGVTAIALGGGNFSSDIQTTFMGGDVQGRGIFLLAGTYTFQSVAKVSNSYAEGSADIFIVWDDNEDFSTWTMSKILNSIHVTGTTYTTQSATFTLTKDCYVAFYMKISGMNVGGAGFNMFVDAVMLEKGSTVHSIVSSSKQEDIASGMLATGIDIENKKITLTANKFECQNNSGVKTAWLDDMGNFTIRGVYNNLITVIDEDNWDKYIIVRGSGSSAVYYLDVLLCGNFVELNYLPDAFLQATDQTLHLPYYANDNVYTRGYTRYLAASNSTPRLMTADELRMLEGRKMVIKVGASLPVTNSASLGDIFFPEIYYGKDKSSITELDLDTRLRYLYAGEKHCLSITNENKASYNRSPSIYVQKTFFISFNLIKFHSSQTTGNPPVANSNYSWGYIWMLDDDSGAAAMDDIDWQ